MTRVGNAGRSRPPRLLLIATGIDRRGAETHVLALGRGLAARGWEVAVAYWGGSGELAPEFRAAGVAVHRLRLRGKLDPGNLPAFVRLIRAFRPDVVHTHLPLAELYGNLAAALCRVPAVVSTKHSDHALFRRPLVRLGHVAVSAPNGAVVAVSAHMAAFIRSVGLWPGTRVETIHNGLDARAVDRAGGPGAVAALRRALAPGGGPLLGAAGRLEPEKGFQTLVAAMPRVLAALPGATLVIAGEGSRRPQLEALIQRLGLAGRVVLLGQRQDVLTLMHCLDLFVLSSHAEPFGLVLLEAMAARKPVLATAVGGVPEVVQDGVTGDLVPPADSEALAGAAVALLRDPHRRAGYGRAGRRRVEQAFPLQRTVCATEGLYRSLLAGRSYVSAPRTPALERRSA